MNLDVTLAAKVRAVLYALTALGTPVVSYLLAKGYIGSDEMVFWGAEVTVVSAMAGFKALSPDAPTEKAALDVIEENLEGPPDEG